MHAEISAEVARIIATRRSPARFIDPAPPQVVLEQAFRAALSAPDHGRLQPWRFLVIQADARKKFGGLCADALRASGQQDANVVDRERAKALRAPMIVVAAATIAGEHRGVPDIEKILAVGAAVQNFMLALHAQGFGAAWKTGAVAYSPILKVGLGLEPTDHIVGIVYVGSIGSLPAPRPIVDLASFVTHWS